MGAIETPKVLKGTARIPIINGPKKVHFESTRSLSTRVDILGHGRKNFTCRKINLSSTFQNFFYKMQIPKQKE